MKTEFKIKDLGKPKHILGVRVGFVENGISLFQREYIEEIVITFSFHKGNKVYTPMEPYSTPGKFLESEDSFLSLSSEEEGSVNNSTMLNAARNSETRKSRSVKDFEIC